MHVTSISLPRSYPMPFPCRAVSPLALPFVAALVPHPLWNTRPHTSPKFRDGKNAICQGDSAVNVQWNLNSRVPLEFSWGRINFRLSPPPSLPRNNFPGLVRVLLIRVGSCQSGSSHPQVAIIVLSTKRIWTKELVRSLTHCRSLSRTRCATYFFFGRHENDFRSWIRRSNSNTYSWERLFPVKCPHFSSVELYSVVTFINS